MASQLRTCQPCRPCGPSRVGTALLRPRQPLSQPRPDMCARESRIAAVLCLRVWPQGLQQGVAGVRVLVKEQMSHRDSLSAVLAPGRDGWGVKGK